MLACPSDRWHGASTEAQSSCRQCRASPGERVASGQATESAAGHVPQDKVGRRRRQQVVDAACSLGRPLVRMAQVDWRGRTVKPIRAAQRRRMFAIASLSIRLFDWHSRQTALPPDTP